MHGTRARMTGDGDRAVIVASNRGPISFARRADGEVEPRRGGGGLVAAMAGALQATGGRWIAAAMSDEDREVAASRLVEVAMDEAKYKLRYLSIDPVEYDRYYNTISNRVLWFVHHCLWDLPRSPRFDTGTHRAWDSYRRVNHAFADAMLEEGGALPSDPAYLVQDYHLSLVPSMLRARQPDARIVYFLHIPFAGPAYFRTLPSAMRAELLDGLLGADIIGFQADPWAENFLLCVRHLGGVRVDLRRRLVRWRGREIRIRTYPVAVDRATLEQDAGGDDVQQARKSLGDWRRGMKLVLRVDRTELSKNILRGLLAYETLLRTRPGWRRGIRHLALLNPSREDVPEYRAYTRECLRTAERINDEYGDDDWQPLEVAVQDDRTRVLAAYGIYDVLLVNPVFDGMNLVAKEGPVLNRSDGVLVLSENAGAYWELGRHALAVNPFDVGATADALAAALEMDDQERKRRARGLRAVLRRNRLDRWVSSQLADLER